MIEVFVLAVALSMDAFAVSVGLGAKRIKKTSSMAILAAIYFGLFHAITPFVGFWAGKSVLGWIEIYAYWIAFSLLTLIGGKMIYEALNKKEKPDIVRVSHKVMLVLAIATSIDAMPAGFSLNLLEVNQLLACGVIGLTTFIFSLIGVFVGARSETWLENKAEIFGGIILILIGFKILIF
ncbi:manganese efflux pump MntP [Paraglaciecola sp.]|uniref:manganese efflux pump MntP n=1 Tax=Paraglaciecola sp. TaxID=1920173 RepID=UPI003EF42508